MGAALVIVTQLGKHPDDDKMDEVLKQLRAYVPNTEPERCPLMRQQTRFMVDILQRAADAIEELKGELPADAIEELKEELPLTNATTKALQAPGQLTCSCQKRKTTINKKSQKNGTIATLLVTGSPPNTLQRRVTVVSRSIGIRAWICCESLEQMK